MRNIIMLEEGLSILEEAIVKARMILDGYPTNTLFTPEEYIKFYDCVYYMCVQHHPYVYSMQLYERFKRAMEESICSRVLPSIKDKKDSSFLIELLGMWARYRLMTKCLGGVFLYLDRQLENFNKLPSLKDVSVHCFRNLVCDTFCQKVQNAAISLISEDRAGKLIARDLLKNVLSFFMEVGCGNSYYYDALEKAMLEDTAIYYSRLALEWLSTYSYVDYLLKVEMCLNQEKERVSQCFHQGTSERLLQVVQWHLVGQNASKLIEKQKADQLGQTTYQELLSQCASLSLGDGSSAPPS